MAQRGLGKTMLLGQVSDAWPTKEDVLFWKEASGGLDWSGNSHMGVARNRLYDVADVAYQASVWNHVWADTDPPGAAFSAGRART